jgi:Ca-activated chloride channel family protein
MFCAYVALGLWFVGCGGESGSPGRAMPKLSEGPASLPAAGQPNGDDPADGQPFNTESYDHIVDNPFRTVVQNPLSTFSIDVDTASYAIVRRFLNDRQMPPPGAVRIEELVNYFTYDDPPPQGDVPFSVHIEVAECPWNAQHRLARIGLKGREIALEQRPPSNLVFLIDVSGSMADANKLPLVKSGLKLLVEQLDERDRVAIVVYAGASGRVLPSTAGNERQIILSAIEHLTPGGSTNGASGIELAYQTAAENFIEKATNRVILCTDGDFNVGITSQDQLIRLIEDKARSGVFLTVLGFGMTNYKDSTMEKLADKGNGNYGYIDTQKEARKLLCDQLSGTLITIAKDVKLQIEFNPTRVAAYRLLGYENRVLAAADFNNDAKDAGDIGAGHSVTALYELVPAGQSLGELGPDVLPVDPLRYQKPGDITEAAAGNDLFTLALRYKLPDADTSQRLVFPAVDGGLAISRASGDFIWSAAVTEFGMILRDSKYKGSATFTSVAELARSAPGPDRDGYRAEFIALVEMAQSLAKRK